MFILKKNYIFSIIFVFITAGVFLFFDKGVSAAPSCTTFNGVTTCSPFDGNIKKGQWSVSTYDNHCSVDINTPLVQQGVPCGDDGKYNLYSIWHGTITYMGPLGLCGNAYTIKTSPAQNGTNRTLWLNYCHLDSFNGSLGVGRSIKAGELLGKIGSSDGTDNECKYGHKRTHIHLRIASTKDAGTGVLNNRSANSVPEKELYRLPFLRGIPLMQDSSVHRFSRFTKNCVAGSGSCACGEKLLGIFSGGTKSIGGIEVVKNHNEPNNTVRRRVPIKRIPPTPEVINEPVQNSVARPSSPPAPPSVVVDIPQDRVPIYNAPIKEYETTSKRFLSPTLWLISIFFVAVFASFIFTWGVYVRTKEDLSVFATIKHRSDRFISSVLDKVKDLLK